MGESISEPGREEYSTEKMREYLKEYRAAKIALIKGAALVRHHGVSHRDFKVGCCAMGKEPEGQVDKVEEFLLGLGGKSKEPAIGDKGLVVYSAYNFTLEPARPGRLPEEKKCAERNAIEAALSKRCELIVAIVTVSKETATGDPSKERGVLHPCRECRDLYRGLLQQGILREESIICCVNDAGAKPVEEERTVKELLAMYADDEKDN